MPTFQNIPFARASRFRLSEPVPFGDLPPADVPFGPAAPQNPDPLDRIWGERIAPGSESDCLSLNVWTPGADSTRRPVMVWIHGGAFVIGAGRWPWYRGSALPERGTVVVTLNYRLGAFGFLDLSEVGGPEYAESGNLGLLDQIEALKWVRANIHRFGGDPDNVTVFGESAGGISVCCLMALADGRAKGLFHRAICMSGPPNLVRSAEYARRATRRVMTAARVETVAQLEALSTAQLLAAQHAALRRAEVMGELLFAPTVGGSVLPRFPLHAIADGSAKGIALMTGTTLDEARLWGLYFPVLRVLPAAALRRWFVSLGLDPDALRAAYRAARPDLGLGKLAMAMAGDALFWLPQLRLAEAQAKHRPHDTRVYSVNWQTPVLAGRLGAPHGVEVPFIFGTIDQSNAPEYIGSGADRPAFVNVLATAWANFARTGDASHAGLPPWPAFDADRRTTMILDRTSQVENDPLAPIRTAWDRLPFDGVSPSAEQLPRVSDVGGHMARLALKWLAGAAAVGAGAWLLARFVA